MEPIFINCENTTISITPRVSAKAKHLSIKISSQKGVEVILPKKSALKKAEHFVQKKRHWIIKHANALPKKLEFLEGKEIQIAGNTYIISHSGKLRGVSQLKDNQLIVSGYKEHIPRKVKDFLKQYAKNEITALATCYAGIMNVSFKKISIKDTTTRWGSCTANGNLSFSWRLILAPYETLKYVVVHELAHRTEMNHSKSFWNIVENTLPEYKPAKYWLQKNGQSLHQYH